MNAAFAVLLGLIQGVTEFLPVSSSGHLVLAQHALGLREPMVFFDVMLHVGTLGAVCAFYWRDLLGLVGIRVAGALATPRTALFIILGTIPTGVIGIAGRNAFTHAFGSVLVPACGLIVTGCLLWTTRYTAKRRHPAIGWRDAVAIGFAQGLAITPGISRSGTTIAAGLWLGLDRDMAARYSFLLAIPAILGAVVLEWEPPATLDGGTMTAIALGTLTAAVTGYLSLLLLVRIVQQGAFWKFAPYCWFIGALGLVLISQPPRRSGETIEAHRITPAPYAVLAHTPAPHVPLR